MTIFKEDDLVLATVKNIEGTIVFLNLDTGERGSMMLSEVAPGRIRNLREFVTPGKKVVCKILRVYPDHLELSLRRVSAKERDMVLDRYKKEKTLFLMLKPVLKEGTEKIIAEIEQKHENLAEFLDNLKANPSLIESFVSKPQAEALKKILSEKKDKSKEIKKTIFIKSLESGGINSIKEVLNTNEAKINYLGSSKFLVIVEDKDFKHGNAKMEALLAEMKEKSKKLNLHFEVK